MRYILWSIVVVAIILTVWLIYSGIEKVESTPPASFEISQPFDYEYAPPIYSEDDVRNQCPSGNCKGWSIK